MAGNTFASLLNAYIERYQRDHKDVTRADLARRCGRSPAWLSVQTSGSRKGRTKSDTALRRLIRVLELSTNEIHDLEAAIDSPLTDGARQSVLDRVVPAWVGRSAINGIPEFEKQYMQEMFEEAAKQMYFAWEQYSRLRRSGLERDYESVIDEVGAAVKAAEALQASAVRIAGWLEYLDVAARQHVPTREFRSTEEERLDAIEHQLAPDARGDAYRGESLDDALLCMVRVRRGDIARLTGGLDEAAQHYRAALDRLTRMDPKSLLAGHWSAVVRRKEATLLVYRGSAREGGVKLEHLLREIGDADAFRYERIRALVSLGWARNMLGDREEGMARHREALDLTSAMVAQQPDPWAEFEANFYLAGDHFDLGDLAAARRFANAAHSILSRSPDISQDVDAGRFWVLWARLEAATESRSSASRKRERIAKYLDSAARIYDDALDSIHLAPYFNVRGEQEEYAGALDTAYGHYERAMTIAGANGQDYSECASLVNLARVSLRRSARTTERLERTRLRRKVNRYLTRATELAEANGYLHHLARAASIEIALVRSGTADPDRESHAKTRIAKCVATVSPLGPLEREINRSERSAWYTEVVGQQPTRGAR